MAQSTDFQKTNYPLAAYNFRVKVDQTEMSFSEVTGIAVEYDHDSYRHGLTFLEGESIICFADVRGDAGETLVVPMWHKTAAATRSHYQTISARVSDAPRAGEIVVIAAASTGPRPHARIGDRKTDPTVSAESWAENLERDPSW